MADKNKDKQSRFPKPMSTIATVFWTGLFGGIFWAAVGYLSYVLSFVEFGPNIILDPWALGSWKHGWGGSILSIILIGILSVGAAFAYFLTLKRIKGMLPGIGFGLILFFLVYVVLNPLFQGMAPFLELKRDTIITSLCLYILYGIFIGYSISYDYQIQKVQENEPIS